MPYIQYVSGNEKHSSTWDKFRVMGLEKFVAKEEHDDNRHDKHHSYQCWEGEVPDQTVFTAWFSTGDKHGTSDQWFGIYLVDQANADQTISGSHPCFVTGQFIALVKAESATKAPRLLDWWTSRPTGTREIDWARHLALHINTRGLKKPPPIA